MIVRRNQGQNQGRSSREQPFNNPAGGYDNEPEDFTKRMERYKTKRDSGMPSRSQPQEIDFTLDGSGSKVQQERMQRQQMEQMERNGGGGMQMGGMSQGMPMGMDGMNPMGMMGNMSSGMPSECQWEWMIHTHHFWVQEPQIQVNKINNCLEWEWEIQ